MADAANHLCAATFLHSQSTKEIWRRIQEMWTLVYVGPPGFTTINEGYSYICKEMRENLEAKGIDLEKEPVEHPGRIGLAERYHSTFRAAFTKIWMDRPDTTSNTGCFRVAVYSVNANIGLNELYYILILFGDISCHACAIPSTTQMERTETIYAAMLELGKEQAHYRIDFGLRHTSEPNQYELSDKLDSLLERSPLLIYRTTIKEGKYHTLLST